MQVESLAVLCPDVVGSRILAPIAVESAEVCECMVPHSSSAATSSKYTFFLQALCLEAFANPV